MAAPSPHQPDIPVDIAFGQMLDQFSDPARWVGPSGRRVPGTTIAQHLEAAMRLVDSQGERDVPPPSRRFLDALVKVRGGGSADIPAVAQNAVQTLLQFVTGVPHVDIEVWSKRPDRTLSELLAVLQAAGGFARKYGPSTSGVAL